MGGKNDEDIDSIIESLPSEKGWVLKNSYRYEGFWFDDKYLQGILKARKNFKPEPNSVMLATFPKSGTTWFASLLFTTINRSRCDYPTHPLLTCTPQRCLTWIELYLQGITPIAQVSSARPLIRTHIPYTLLPESIKSSHIPIVYVCRDPMDVFVSYWLFAKKLRLRDQLPCLKMDVAFDMYSRGVCTYGSYWDNVLTYWKASLEMPERVLFLRYEDMKKHPITTMKKFAQFMGSPFSLEEEKNGVIEEIVDFCSFESMASLEVNQDVTFKKYFRKGEVGDHKNYLSDDKIRHLKEITDARFKGSGLNVYA